MSRPFKGRWFYEWQVGPIVFQFRHADFARFTENWQTPTTLPWFKRINIWRDTAWSLPFRFVRPSPVKLLLDMIAFVVDHSSWNHRYVSLLMRLWWAINERCGFKYTANCNWRDE